MVGAACCVRGFRIHFSAPFGGTPSGPPHLRSQGLPTSFTSASGVESAESVSIVTILNTGATFICPVQPFNGWAGHLFFSYSCPRTNRSFGQPEKNRKLDRPWLCDARVDHDINDCGLARQHEKTPGKRPATTHEGAARQVQEVASWRERGLDRA